MWIYTADEINKALELSSGFTNRSVSWNEQVVVMPYTLLICSYSSLCGSNVFLPQDRMLQSEPANDPAKFSKSHYYSY